MMQSLTKNLCSKCRALLIVRLTREAMLLSTKSISIDEENIEVLKQLGVPENQSAKLYQKLCGNKASKQLQLKLVVEHLQKLKFTSNQIVQHPSILKLPLKLMDHRFKVFEEGGFYTNKITISIIQQFHKNLKNSVHYHKKHGFIEPTIDVTRNILSYCDLPPQLYSAEADDSLSLEDAQIIALKAFVKWKFNLSEEETEKPFKIYKSVCRKSIRLMVANYELLKEEFGLSFDMIRANLYLLFHHPQNYRDTLQQVPKIGNVPLIEVSKASPKLLLLSPEKLLGRIQVLKDFDLSLDNLKVYADVLLLSSQTLRERLETLQKDPDFKAFLHHHRIFRAILFFHKTRRRLKLFNEMNWRCQSLDTLSLQSKKFQCRLKAGGSASIGVDIIYYLEKEMEMTRNEVRNVLKQNPVWNYASLRTITATLQLLRDEGFTCQQICSALTLVLYPSVKVQQVLKVLDSKPEVDCCRDPKTGRIRPELTLHLVLYFLERPFHFKGTGIFIDQPTPIPYDPTSMIT